MDVKPLNRLKFPTGVRKLHDLINVRLFSGHVVVPSMAVCPVALRTQGRMH